MITCVHFNIDELVASEILAICSAQVCWGMIPDQAKRVLDVLRSCLGSPIWINSAKHGFNYSGVRPVNCKIGARYSNHKKGVAFDLKTFDQDKLEELLRVVRTSWKVLGITRIENPEKTLPGGWLHVEFGDVTGQNELVEFNP